MGRYRRSLVVFNKLEGPPTSVSTGTTKWVTIIEYINSTGLLINPYVIHIRKRVKLGQFLPNDELLDWHWSFSKRGGQQTTSALTGYKNSSF